jgi:hypothetical protein
VRAASLIPLPSSLIDFDVLFNLPQLLDLVLNLELL